MHNHTANCFFGGDGRKEQKKAMKRLVPESALGQAAGTDAMKWQLTILVCMLAVAALVLRVIDLDRRPMHADEGVQGLKFIELLENGKYRYDPDEYHGPTLNYLTLPVAWLRGEHNRQALTETTLRLVPAVFGAGLVLLLFMVRDGLGRSATVSAALVTAISPALVFYGRYYIHETLLVFFTLAFLGACWRYLQTRRWGWAVGAGAAFGLMHATKETFVLELFAMAVALAIVIVTAHKRRNAPESPGHRAIRIRWSDVGIGLVVAIVVSVVFYTSFFQYWRGPVDSVLTYFPWLRRAGGASPHIHPWWFYLERLAFFKRQSGPVWSEASLLVLTIAGIGVAIRPGLLPSANAQLVRFIAIYSIVLAGVYSAISYKTPWCILGFYHGFVLLAGVGVAGLLANCRTNLARGVCVALLAALLGHLGFQTWRTAYAQPADRRNPYVYAHSSMDLLRLVDKVNAIARADPNPDRFAIQIMAPGGDYWPLPWYFRKYRHTGWWSEIPENPYAPVMVVGAKFHADLDEKSEKRWLMVGFFESRPGVFFELYVELELWKKYVETLPRDDD